LKKARHMETLAAPTALGFDGSDSAYFDVFYGTLLAEQECNGLLAAGELPTGGSGSSPDGSNPQSPAAPTLPGVTVKQEEASSTSSLDRPAVIAKLAESKKRHADIAPILPQFTPFNEESSSASPGDPNFKRQKRLMKNRESAQTSRNRKKAYLDELERKINSLSEDNQRLLAENSHLRAELDQLRGGKPAPPPLLSQSNAAKAAGICLLVALFSFGLLMHSPVTGTRPGLESFAPATGGGRALQQAVEVQEQPVPMDVNGSRMSSSSSTPSTSSPATFAHSNKPFSSSSSVTTPTAAAPIVIKTEPGLPAPTSPKSVGDSALVPVVSSNPYRQAQPPATRNPLVTRTRPSTQYLYCPDAQRLNSDGDFYADEGLPSSISLLIPGEYINATSMANSLVEITCAVTEMNVMPLHTSSLEAYLGRATQGRPPAAQAEGLPIAPAEN
jgi:hypothetical protein